MFRFNVQWSHQYEIDNDVIVLTDFGHIFDTNKIVIRNKKHDRNDDQENVYFPPTNRSILMVFIKSKHLNWNAHEMTTRKMNLFMLYQLPAIV